MRKSNMKKLLLLNEVTHCTVDYTIHFQEFTYDDCADLHSRGEDIADNVLEVIYSCIKSNNECEDPLGLKKEISSLRWIENDKKKKSENRVFTFLPLLSF